MKKWLVRRLQRLLTRLGGYIYVYVPKESFWARTQVRGDGWITLRFNAGEEGFHICHDNTDGTEQFVDIVWLDVGNYRDIEAERLADQEGGE